MPGRIEAITGESRQIDSADERGFAIDEHELLVVAMQRALSSVESAADAGARRELAAHVASLASVWVKERQWGARPDKDAYVHPLRGLCEQVPQRRPFAAEPEVGRKVPARDPDMGPGLLDLVRDARQGFGSVDDHLELVAGTGWWIALGPTAARSVEGAQLADAPQAAPMV
jgi:hypothetical protein